MTAIMQALAMVVALLLTVSGGPIVAHGMPDTSPMPDTPIVETPPDAPAEQPAAIVRMTDNRFRPARVTVPAGSVVRWINVETDESVEHNVIARDYRWASDNFLPGESYQRTFATPGTYRYFCDLHGGMTGQVIVE